MTFGVAGHRAGCGVKDAARVFMGIAGRAPFQAAPPVALRAGSPVVARVSSTGPASIRAMRSGAALAYAAWLLRGLVPVA